jgi:hypothetical protein
MLNVPVHRRIATSVDETPFACGQAERPLRIVIDELTAPDGAATRLLYAFGGCSGAEVYGTARGRSSRVVIAARDPSRVRAAGGRWPPDGCDVLK